MEGVSVHQVATLAVMARDLHRAEPEFRAFVDRMDEDAQAALVAVMWIGRGVFEAADWDEAFRTAFSEASTPTAEYLIGTPHLADHLEAGLEAFGHDVGMAEDAVLGPSV